MFGNNNVKPLSRVDESYIGEEMRITGVISASKPVILLGQIDGNIEADSVHIRSTAIVNGDINAGKVTVDGTRESIMSKLQERQA